MLQWLSLFEEEESLLISISIFCLYKEQKYSFKRLAVVTQHLVSRISCMCIFTVSFGSFQLVNSPRDCAKCAF